MFVEFWAPVGPPPPVIQDGVPGSYMYMLAVYKLVAHRESEIRTSLSHIVLPRKACCSYNICRACVASVPKLDGTIILSEPSDASMSFKRNSPPLCSPMVADRG